MPKYLVTAQLLVNAETADGARAWAEDSVRRWRLNESGRRFLTAAVTKVYDDGGEAWPSRRPMGKSGPE